MLRIILTGILIASCLGTMPASADVVIYRFAKIIDGTGDVLNAHDIAVEGKRIKAVGNNLDKSFAGHVVMMEGLTALPGLIDAHTHITYGLSHYPAGDAWAALGKIGRAERYAAAKTNALKTLQTGVTSVRDLNADQRLDFDLQAAINAGEVPGPRIYTSGPGIHPFNDPLPDGTETASTEFLAEAAKKRIAMGADWIKIFGTTGSASDLTSRAYYSADAIAAATAAAKKAGKRITVHTYGPEAVDAAIAAGVTSIDHPVGMSAAQIKAMASADIIYVPTIDHNRYYAQHANQYGYDADIQAGLRVFVGRNIKAVRQAHVAGVTVAMGSDAVLSGFGENTCELKAFIAAGMSAVDAIQTATVNGAKLLGEDANLGRLQPGFEADFVAVSGDPLSDISAITNGVTVVMKAGELVVDHRVDPAHINQPNCGTLY